ACVAAAARAPHRHRAPLRPDGVLPAGGRARTHAPAFGAGPHRAHRGPAPRTRRGPMMGIGHGHASSRHRWRLAVSFALIGSYFMVELVYGLLSDSLALLSDAGHMAADVVTLGAALVATRIATRPDTTGR